MGKFVLLHTKEVSDYKIDSNSPYFKDYIYESPKPIYKIQDIIVNTDNIEYIDCCTGNGVLHMRNGKEIKIVESLNELCFLLAMSNTVDNEKKYSLIVEHVYNELYRDKYIKESLEDFEIKDGMKFYDISCGVYVIKNSTKIDDCNYKADVDFVDYHLYEGVSIFKPKNKLYFIFSYKSDLVQKLFLDINDAFKDYVHFKECILNEVEKNNADGIFNNHIIELKEEIRIFSNQIK